MISFLKWFVLQICITSCFLPYVFSWAFVCCVSGPRHSSALLLGDDLCLRSFRELRCLWRLRQHLLHLQPQDSRGERACQPWAGRTHRYRTCPPETLTHSDLGSCEYTQGSVFSKAVITAWNCTTVFCTLFNMPHLIDFNDGISNYIMHSHSVQLLYGWRNVQVIFHH